METKKISAQSLVELGIPKELAVAFAQILSRIAETQAEITQNHLVIKAANDRTKELEQIAAEREKTINTLNTNLGAREVTTNQLRNMLASLKTELAQKDQKITDLEKILKKGNSKLTQAENRLLPIPIEEKKDPPAEKEKTIDMESAKTAPLEAEKIKELFRKNLETDDVTAPEVVKEVAEQMIDFLLTGEKIQVKELQGKIGCHYGTADHAATLLAETGLAKTDRERGMKVIWLADQIEKQDEAKPESSPAPDEDKQEERKPKKPDKETDEPFGHEDAEIETSPIEISDADFELLARSVGITSDNKKKILASILKHPGATIKEISEETGISGNNIFTFSNPLLVNKTGLGLIVKKQKSPGNRLIKAFWPIKNIVQKMQELAEKVKPAIPQSELGQEPRNTDEENPALFVSLADLIEKKILGTNKNWRKDKIERLALLIDFMMDNKEIPVTVETIAKRFRCSPQTPVNWMNDLESLGIVSIETGQSGQMVFKLNEEAIPPEILASKKSTAETEKTEEREPTDKNPSGTANTHKPPEEKPKKTLSQICATPGLCEAQKEMLVELSKSGGHLDKKILQEKTGLQTPIFNSYLQYMQSLKVIDTNANIVSLIT